MVLTRRDFVRQAGLTLSFSIAGSRLWLTPAQAYTEAIPFNVLRTEEVSTLEAIAECLLPGAKEAGVAHFVDQQLNIDANDSLLMLKYFNAAPPYIDFYRAALYEINKLSNTLYGDNFGVLNQANSHKLIELIRDNNLQDWLGPPAPLVYHAFRNDAVDVVYGTVKGFKKLGVPYMEHILPPEGWHDA